VIGLAQPGAAGSELVFAAASADGTRTWKCMSRGLAPLARPTACREDADGPGAPDRK
jgi:hypothetical protein